MSQIDELKAINRKLDAIEDRRIADNTTKFYKDLSERFPPPDYTRKPVISWARDDLYAGHHKNPYWGGDVLTYDEAKNRFVVSLIGSIICLIINFYTGFDSIIVVINIILIIFTLFEFYFYSTWTQEKFERIMREKEKRSR